MNMQSQLSHYQTRVNNALNTYLPTEETKPEFLHKAMRYAALSNGKRIRAILTYLSGELVDADYEALDIAASSIELIHAFSLIHDDLPALDNDDLRRGQPTCHKAFDEYTAILAGDALQSMAFELLARLRKRKNVNKESSLEMIEILSHAIGSRGMAGGEYLDLAMTDLKQESGLNVLEKIYKLKTGKLLLASIYLGLLAGNCNDKNILMNMARYGLFIGLAFQIHDDVLEVEQSTETLGKSNTADIDNNKPTYISLGNLEYAKEQEKYCYDKAIEHLNKTNLDVANLINVSEYIIYRNH